MLFKLGAVLVKGGKVISTGHNHHRTHYDGNDAKRKPVSMHAEMHAIFNACVGVLNRLFETLQLPANLHVFRFC
jgi:tRNA(Arg) A34 adenosine deaminase TadA